jgi:hypothetical protein
LNTNIYGKFEKNNSMKKIFVQTSIFLVIIIVAWGYIFKFKPLDIDFSKFNPFKKSELDIIEDRLLKRVSQLEAKSDSLQPILSKYQKETDSLMKKDFEIDKELVMLKQKDLIFEKKFNQSRDSMNKYRNSLKDVVKKYEDMKKNPKNYSNKETIDFFKKY